jgi:hypothetical protein
MTRVLRGANRMSQSEMLAAFMMRHVRERAIHPADS